MKQLLMFYAQLGGRGTWMLAVQPSNSRAQVEHPLMMWPWSFMCLRTATGMLVSTVFLSHREPAKCSVSVRGHHSLPSELAAHMPAFRSLLPFKALLLAPTMKQFTSLSLNLVSDHMNFLCVFKAYL